MNKGQLIESVAKKTAMSNAAAGKAVDAVLASIEGALKKGDSVTLVGFGTFLVKKRAARTGVNPATGDKIKIKAKKVVAFKAGAGLKNSVK
jgi:DNA-binding protein HU-beta